MENLILSMGWVIGLVALLLVGELLAKAFKWN
jgi:hypothetical protein